MKKWQQEIKKSILKNLKVFENLSGEEIFNQRKTKFLKIGRDQGFKKSIRCFWRAIGLC